MNLPIEIKKQLAQIIKYNRMYKLEKTRSNKWTVNNPYNKDNLCKDVCHYYTLIKLEDMEKLTEILNTMLKASEYLDDDLMETAHDSLIKLDLDHDAIAYIHFFLLKTLYKLYFFAVIDDFYLEQLTINQAIFLNIYS